MDNSTLQSLAAQRSSTPTSWLATKTFHWSLLIIGSTSFAMNSLFSAMFLKFRKKVLTVNNNKILFSMTLADSLVGIFCILLASSLITKQSQVVYKMFGVLPLFGSMFASILSLGTMTLDRLVAIKAPLRHKSIMLPKRVLLLILLSWLLPGLITIQDVLVYLQYSWQKELKIRGYFLFIVFMTGSIFLMSANFHLYTVIQKHIRFLGGQMRIAERAQRGRVFSDSSSSAVIDQSACARIMNSCRNDPKFRKLFLGELRAARMCVMIVMAFVCCWAPLTAYRMSYSVGRKVGIPWLRRLCLLLASLNSVINPIVYLLMRNSFQSLIWRFFTGQQQRRTIVGHCRMRRGRPPLQ